MVMKLVPQMGKYGNQGNEGCDGKHRYIAWRPPGTLQLATCRTKFRLQEQSLNVTGCCFFSGSLGSDHLGGK